MYPVLSRKIFNNLNQFNGTVNVFKLFNKIPKKDSLYTITSFTQLVSNLDAFYWNIIVMNLIEFRVRE